MSDQTREPMKKQDAPSRASHEAHFPPSSDTSLVNNFVSPEGQPLDSEVRAWAGPRFGHDFSKVRVHTDSQAAQSARSVGALAYTVGQHIVFGAGQYQPETLSGQHTLLHELTHVMQQRDAVANLSASDQPDQLQISDPGDAAEYEADRVSHDLLAPEASQQGNISPVPVHPLKTLRLQRITRPLEDWGEHRGSEIEVQNPVLQFFVRGNNVFSPRGAQPFEGDGFLPERVSVPLNDKGHLQFFADVHVKGAGYVIAATKDAKISGLWEITNSGGKLNIEGGIRITKDDNSYYYPKTWRLRANDEKNEAGHSLTINIILEDIATKTIKDEASELKLGAEAKAGIEPKVEGEIKGAKVGVSAGGVSAKAGAEVKIPLGKTTETTIPGQKEVIPLVIDLQPVMAPPKPEQPEYETLPPLFFQTGSHELEISAKESKVPGMGVAEFVKHLNEMRETSEGRSGRNLEFILVAEASPLGKRGQTPQQASEFNKDLSRRRGATIKAIVHSVLPEAHVSEVALGSSLAVAAGEGPLSDEQIRRIVRITLHRIKSPR